MATAVAAALLVAGCGGSGEPAAVGEVPVPSTTANGMVTSTTVGPPDIEQVVLEAYLANWDAWEQATDPADPGFPGLAETRTGPALKAAVDQITAWRASGRVARDPDDSISEHRVEVVSVDGDEAMVRECGIDNSLIVIAETGEVVNDRVQTLLFEGHMVVEEGRWKLSSLLIEDEWEGVAGCAVQ